MSKDKNNDWLVGVNPVQAMITADVSRIISLQISKETKAQPNKRIQKLLDAAAQQGVMVEELRKEKFEDRFNQYGLHQGIAARIKPINSLRDKEFEQWLKSSSEENCLILILDQVKDPHNLGAILRTADAVGVDAVIVPDKNSSPVTPVVHKVASGATATVKLYRVNNLARTIEKIKKEGVWVVGTSDAATISLYDYKVSQRQALILGAEGEGMRRLTAELCDDLIYIPMSGIVSSLNVSVAAGVALYEMRRKTS